MREIKFRVWDKINKQMHPVYQLQFQKNGLNIKTIGSFRSPENESLKNPNNIILMQYPGKRIPKK